MSTDPDPYELRRFVEAQDQGDTYDAAIEELQQGRKRSHWIWFVFPQIEGLGSSPTARRFAISGLDEARAYLRHPVLGPRLLEAARTVTEITGVSAGEIFGAPDDAKVRSSMTLFLRADPDQPLFQDVLDHLYGGEPDEATDARV
jgi:uncharacterized protein (DUF1810 family)